MPTCYLMNMQQWQLRVFGRVSARELKIILEIITRNLLLEILFSFLSPMLFFFSTRPSIIPLLLPSRPSFTLNKIKLCSWK